jgi:Carboxypeptidase regulatory-like domain
MCFISSFINSFTMKRTAFILLGFGLALEGIAQLPAYDTSVYTFIRSAATDSVIAGQQQMYKEQTVLINGTVVDQNNRPIQGAVAILGNNQHNTVTDADGRFAFTLPHQSLSPYNVVRLSAPGKKTLVQTLHWTALPTAVNFQMQPLLICGCPPDSIKTRCCDINIQMSIDELFEKEATSPIKKKLVSKRKKSQLRKPKRYAQQ